MFQKFAAFFVIGMYNVSRVALVEKIAVDNTEGE